jgi:hypothetical protein
VKEKREEEKREEEKHEEEKHEEKMCKRTYGINLLIVSNKKKSSA